MQVYYVTFDGEFYVFTNPEARAEFIDMVAKDRERRQLPTLSSSEEYYYGITEIYSNGETAFYENIY
jgi:hypothetical protein